jgi:hypothetical protein
LNNNANDFVCCRHYAPSAAKTPNHTRPHQIKTNPTNLDKQKQFHIYPTPSQTTRTEKLDSTQHLPIRPPHTACRLP